MQARSNSLLLLLILFLSLGIVGVSRVVVPSHAASPGLVCLANVVSPPLSDPCTGTIVFNGPVTTPNQQLRVGVFVYNSPGVDGFDIILLADHTVLKPAGVDLTGSVLTVSPTPLVECLSGFNVTGGTCPATDTADTLNFAAVAYTVTGSPTTGLLFTAVYNVTGSTSASGISVGFQTGCSLTSDGSYCVTVANGSPIPVPETVQSATFNNSSPPPYVSMTSNSTVAGPVVARVQTGLVLNLTGQNGWSSEGCPCTVSMSSVASSSLTVHLNVSSVQLPGTGSKFVGLTVSGSRGGNYSLTVYAEYSTFDLNNFNTSTLVAVVNANVIIQDFTVTASPASLNSLAGATAASTVTVAPVNRFAGTVGLTLSASPSGLSCSVSPSSIVLGVSQNSTLSCSGPAGNYAVKVSGRSGLLDHTANVTDSVADFSMSANPASVTGDAGLSLSSTVTVSPLNGFVGNVTLSAASAAGSCNLSPVNVTLSGPGTSQLSCSFTSADDYNVTVTGVSGSVSNTVKIGFVVEDFDVSVSVGQVSVVVGSSVDVTVSLSSLNGFGAAVPVYVSPPVGLTVTPVATSVLVPGSVVLNVTGNAVGNYTLTIVSNYSGDSHSTTVRVVVVAASTAPGTILGLAPLLFYAVLGILIVAVAVAVFLIVRRQGRNVKGPVKNRGKG